MVGYDAANLNCFAQIVGLYSLEGAIQGAFIVAED